MRRHPMQWFLPILRYLGIRPVMQPAQVPKKIATKISINITIFLILLFIDSLLIISKRFRYNIFKTFLNKKS